MHSTMSRRPPGPTLLRIASDRQYDRILDHIQERPQDVIWQDHYGSTTLHTLCLAQTIDKAVLDAVAAILKEAPQLVRQPNHASWTPLHLACEKRLLWRTITSADTNNNINNTNNDNINDALKASQSAAEQLILLLIHACPDAVSVTLTSGFKAKTPFHIACENNASVIVLREMLRIDPSLALLSSIKKTQDPFTISDTPLQELWNVLCKTINTTTTERGQSSSSSSIMAMAMAKMKVLLHAAYMGTVDGDNDNNDDDEVSDFHILCAACSVRCPRDYISQLIEDHPHLIRQPDASNGLFPLHYAVQSAEPSSPYFTDFLLDELLTAYPEAAAIPLLLQQQQQHKQQQQLSGDTTTTAGTSSAGRLPVHVLIADRACTRPGGGVMRLIKSFPESLRVPDPRSGLVPALASAESAIQSRMHLTTTYELLRAAPDVIQNHNIHNS